MGHSNKERDNVAESRPGSNTDQQWSVGYKRQLDLKKGAIPTKMSIYESKSTSLSELLRRSVAIVSHFTRGVGATCGSVFNW